MIKSYVLNDYLKFDRKLYNLFGHNIGRAISLRALLWFIGITAGMFILSVTPIVGALVNWIPFLTKIALCIGITWFITDVGTENRSPIRFFTSFFAYHIRKVRNESYYKGKVLKKEKVIKFERLPSIRGNVPVVEKEKTKSVRFSGFTVR